MKPGDMIEVFEKTDENWHKYKVLDWEEPRQDKNGKWLFTAQAIGHCCGGISPMIVEDCRIRPAI